MTCSTCGNVLAQDVRFCPRCGTQTSSQPPLGPPYVSVPLGLPYDRVSRNLQALGNLWLLYAGLRALAGLVGMLFLHGLFSNHFGHSDFNLGWSPFGRMWMDSLWPIALFSIMVSVGCTVLTGYALLTRQPWGRVLAIVFSIFALFHFPLGTALGIYTLWVLAPRFSGDEYAALAYRQHGA
jgi:ABC-type glycerol-3-phosphate transport system permease component